MRSVERLVRRSISCVRNAKKVWDQPAIDYCAPLDSGGPQCTDHLIGEQDVAFAYRLRDIFFSRFLVDSEKFKASVFEVIANVPSAVDAAAREWLVEYRIYGEAMQPLCEQPPWRHVQRTGRHDVLYRVRVHRFAFLPRLMLAVVDGKIKSSEVIEFLSDWCRFATRKRNRDVAFVSTLVVIQRDIAIVWAYAILAAVNSEADRALSALILKILKIDLQQISSKLGYAAPNNHLLVDYFAGWFFGQIFDGVFTQQWTEKHEHHFVEEFCRQVLKDGTGFECSTHYHEFDLEVGTCYTRMLRRQGRRESAEVTQRLFAALRFKLAIWPTDFGNGTEDPLFPLTNNQKIPIRAWERIANSLGACPDLNAPPLACEENWYSVLIGIDHRIVEPRKERFDGNTHAFLDGGCIALVDNKTGLKVVLRTAPSDRTMVTAGHAHADLLSLTLSERGLDILQDAGTFTYRHRPNGALEEPDWREYFAGPESHNNVSIGKADPLGQIKGDFREGTFHVEAEYSDVVDDDSIAFMKCRLQSRNEYDKLFRSVIYKKSDYVLVIDLLPPRVSLGEAKSSYQFSDRYRIENIGSHEVLLSDGTQVWSVCVSEHSGGFVHRLGSMHPVGGWVSKEYGVRIPAVQLAFSFRTSPIAATLFAKGECSPAVKAGPSDASEAVYSIEVFRNQGDVDRFLLSTSKEPQLLQGSSFQNRGHLAYALSGEKNYCVL